MSNEPDGRCGLKPGGEPETSPVTNGDEIKRYYD